MPWEANGSKAIAASPTASQPDPNWTSRHCDLAERAAKSLECEGSPNCQDTWTVRPSCSSHHAHSSCLAPRGNRSSSVTNMHMLRVALIGAQYHQPVSAASTMLRVPRHPSFE